jgi:hypothetical protein
VPVGARSAERAARLRGVCHLSTVPGVRRLVSLLLFLTLIQDKDAAYRDKLVTPFAWVRDYLLDPTAIKVRPFDLIMLAILGFAATKRDGMGPSVPPMRNALLLMLATTVLWYLYGILRGGDARYASWQTYTILSCILLAFTLASTFRTPAHFQGLAKWLVAAATYRGIMCWASYLTWARGIVGGSGAYLTDHNDTILWVVSIVVLIVNAVDKRSLPVTLRNVALILFFLGAIQWNSRRIAWVSLALALLVIYLLYPYGVAKRKINRVALMMLPAILIYVFVGWGREERIFLPLRSISSVSTQEDASTLARNAENLGLIATVRYSSMIMGTGWGVPYAAITNKYDISGFELWKYVPHNSILGLLAFTGILGFAGFWVPMPTAVFLNARVARLSSDPIAKNVAIVAVGQMIVTLNQLYGDMGILSMPVMYVLAVSFAIALRLPRAGGVWERPLRERAKVDS